jgi:hypothetical protein
MGVKDLFENPQGNKILSSEDFDKEVQKVESLENMQAKFYEKRRYMPNVDFSKPKNFARYGLAKDYYVDAVDRIIREYPYDGSLKERTIFLNSSSYLDSYVLESRYPRTTGYIKLSAGGWGQLDGSLVGEYGKSEDVEYIKILGGPHTASGGMPTGSLYRTFTGSNIYDDSIYDTDGVLANTRLGSRGSNLEFNSANGCTIEFWMRKFDYAGTGLTKKEVIFDLWNQNNTGSSTLPSYLTDDKYGRLTLELSSSNQGSRGLGSGVHDGATFYLTLQSGSSVYGFSNQSVAASTVTTASVTDKKWHHYAVTIASASTADNHGTEVKFYVDGKLNNSNIYGTMGVGNITGSLIANIGALIGTPSGSTYKAQAASAMIGYGKLSASLDEFRYWKVARTDEQILNNYKYQVGGGTNTDISNTELGVYYKFNEGIAQSSSIDSVVLDYSGRISNGTWTGYIAGSSRDTGSAMVSASVVSKEYHDPIIYSTHPDVVQLRSDLEATGSLYDHQNNSSLYHSLPGWVVDDDQLEGSEHLKKLSQILASHFDTLHLQIESLSHLKDTTYLSSSFKPAKPVPFANRLLTSKGFVAPEIFADADLVSQVLARDEEREFELDLSDIKNFIYKNIYNNLTGIYKSKGTEKAFRNLIRCYGIGDEVIKLKAYANNVLYSLEDTHYLTAVPKRTINFNDPNHFGATVFQNSGTTDEQRAVVVSSSVAYTTGYPQRVDVPFTMECEVIFPKKLSTTDEQYFTTDFVSSSICGWHRPLESAVLAETFNTFHGTDYNLQVYAVRPEQNSNDAYFVLTGSHVDIGISIETETYKDVYNNEKWNFAVRGHREKRITAGRVTGSVVGSIDDNLKNTVVEFLGFNYAGDILQESFHLTGNTNITGAVFSSVNKRFYVGADRTGFSGSVITKSDVKISQLRYWQSFVSNQALDIHARDIHNYGVLNPYRNAFLNELFAEGNEIPQIETLALHWDFSNITGSDSNGRFLVSDVSSGSVDLANRYSNLAKATKTQHVGLGYGFKASSTASVSVEYLNTAKQQLPETINSSDAVNVLLSDDDEFTKSSAVTQFYYTFEKNMYDTISQEMVNMFGTMAEFNNLIGEPVYRYRHEYKAMNKLRSLFYERIGNTPNLDKYIDYYKWIDDSLSVMLRKLAPVSADVAPEVRTIIESHILERNKYQSKYPIIDTRGNKRFGIDEIEGTARGVNELDYNWKFGHAPVSTLERENEIWWKERIERDTTFGNLKTDKTAVNRGKEKFRKSGRRYDFRSGHRLTQEDFTDKATVYTGSSYAVNRFARPYSLTADLKDSSAPRDIKGGYNFNRTKNFDFIRDSLKGKYGEPTTPSFYIQSLEQPVDSEFGDISNPDLLDSDGRGFKKKKASYSVTYGSTPSTTGDTTAIKLYARVAAPFSLASSSVTTGYQREISHLGYDVAGIHADGVVDGAIQGPFAEQHVGGLQYRHADLNTSGSGKSALLNGLDSAIERAEPYWLLPASTGIQIRTVPVDRARSNLYRYPVAKRPMNIANIRQTTDQITSNGSTKIVSGTLNARMGNFSRVNQVVFVGDRGTNNQAFVRNEGANFGSTSSVHVEALVDYPKLVRDVAEHTIVERFSAPGSPETAGDSQGGPGLDYVSGQYSPYNNLNYRNLGVRLPLRTMLTGVTAQFGFRSGVGSQTNANLYSGLANFHQVHRNTRKRLEITNEFSLSSSGPGGYPINGGAATVATQSVSDNFFVSHVIPQSDLAYSWITSSYISSNELGYMPADGLSKAGVTHTGQQKYDASITFVSQSIGGSYRLVGQRAFTVSTQRTAGPTFVPTTFVGMITNIVEPVNTSSALIGLPLSQSVIGYVNMGPLGETVFDNTEENASNGYYVTAIEESLPSLDRHEASAFSQLMAYRYGGYGFPTWKQIRVGQNPLTRLMRRNNKISVMIPAEEKINDAPTVDEDHITAMAQARAKRGSTRNFIEPAVVMRHSPLEYKFVYETKNNRGKRVDRNVIVKCTLGNAKSKFTHNRLNNLVDFHSNRRRVTGYDDIKEFYLDGALEDPDSPVKKLVSLKYKEKVYPAERNLGLARIRKRNKYQNNFWRTDRTDRVVGGARNTNAFSEEYNYYHSKWPLDAGRKFQVSGTANSPIDSNETFAQPGILQAGWMSQCYEFGKEGAAAMGRMQSGPLYSRFHLLSSTASVVSPTGMIIPETGSELGNVWDGNSYLPGQYQFSGGFFNNDALSQGPYGFPGHGGNLDSSTHLGSAFWQAGEMSGRNETADGITKFSHKPVEPFYDSYDDYLEDLRPLNKEMSVIPEFRISEHIDYYVKQMSEDFMADNPQFLSIPGSKSDHLVSSDSSGSDFYKIFSFSDFMKHFRIIQKDHEEIADPTEITLECKALKKFLPYDGFYPVDRTIQIASQWSSSYGEYISPAGNHWPTLRDGTLVGGPPTGKRPLMQTFFSPGILYNSIKSGIACDWPCRTGSTTVPAPVAMHSPGNRAGARTALRLGHGTSSRGESGWDFRVPFETLVEPEKYISNVLISDMEIQSEISRLQLSASWSGQGDNLYKMMMNNFLAETVKFFLKGQKMTTITSKDESKFESATSGTTYTARLKVYRSMNQSRPASSSWGDYPIPQDPTHELITGVGNGSAKVNGRKLGNHNALRETFTMYSRPSAFGPPVAGFDGRNGNQTDPQVFDSQTGYNPSFTPPYYNGEAWADILWTAEMDGKPTLDEIFSTAKVYNLRIDGKAFWSPGATGSHDSNGWYEGYEFPMASGAANAYSMQFVHSFNIFGKGKKPSVKRQGRQRQGNSDESEDLDVWVIEPKWETPMYNFNTSGIAGSRMLSGSDPKYSLMIPSASSGQGTVPRGMWHQFGVIPTSSEVGVFMQIEDIPDNWVQNSKRVYGIVERDGKTILSASSPSAGVPGLRPRNQEYNGAKSLVDLCGFRTSARRLGQTAKRKRISEAIVAIPFFVEDGEVKYFNIDADIINEAQTNIEQDTKGSDLVSIENMIRKMEKFILPPKFDFIKNSEVTPISMYIFEFSHVLDQDDLSHIWQNLPPKIGKKTMKARSTIKHSLLSNALMGSAILEDGVKMKNKVQWMVFKVKQRADTDYFKVTSKTTPQVFFEDLGGAGPAAETKFEHEENPAIPEYSYNWPYDFFSLIEFASLNAKVTFETPEEEDKSSDRRRRNRPQTVARQNADASRSRGSNRDSLSEDIESATATGDDDPLLSTEASVLSETWYEDDMSDALRDITGISEQD